MNPDPHEVITVLLALSGAALVLCGMMGFARLPDVFCRSHAVGLAQTLGIILMLAALWVDLGIESAGLKITAAIAFQLLTVPVAAHLIAQQARRGEADEKDGGKRKRRRGRRAQQ